MKTTKLIAFLLTASLLSACSLGSDIDSMQTSSNHQTDNTQEDEMSFDELSSVADDSSLGENEENTIVLTVGENQAVVKMLDNDASKDFLNMLPLTLEFEDYNGIEKISSLPNELTLGDSPTNCDPTVGTFAYYVPWGNLSVFYNDFRESENLVPLGTFESGIEFFSNLTEDFTVTIERR